MIHDYKLAHHLHNPVLGNQSRYTLTPSQTQTLHHNHESLLDTSYDYQSVG